MAKKNPLTVSCGDWHLGWGLGGHDKMGKLTLDTLNNSFVWKGSSQGRHGRKWNKGAFLVFTYTDGKITIVHQQGSVPVYPELIKGCEEILTNQMDK